MSAMVWSVLTVDRNETSIPGVRAHERLEEGGEEVDEGLGRGGRAHPAVGLAGPARQALAQGVRPLEDALGVLERGLAGLGELDPLLGPDEERLPELGLEGLDLVAHRRLGEMQPLGGAGEVEGLGHDAEGAELRQLHLR